MRNMGKRRFGVEIFDFSLSHRLLSTLLMLTEEALGVSCSKRLGLEGSLEVILFSGFHTFI